MTPQIDKINRMALTLMVNRSEDDSLTMEQLLTVKQAALMLACTEAAIRKWIYQRRFPVVKVGRLTRLRQSDLEALIATGLRPGLRPALLNAKQGPLSA